MPRLCPRRTRRNRAEGDGRDLVGPARVGPGAAPRARRSDIPCSEATAPRTMRRRSARPWSHVLPSSSTEPPCGEADQSRKSSAAARAPHRDPAPPAPGSGSRRRRVRRGCRRSGLTLARRVPRAGADRHRKPAPSRPRPRTGRSSDRSPRLGRRSTARPYAAFIGRSPGCALSPPGAPCDQRTPTALQPIRFADTAAPSARAAGGPLRTALA